MLGTGATNRNSMVLFLKVTTVGKVGIYAMEMWYNKCYYCNAKCNCRRQYSITRETSGDRLPVFKFQLCHFVGVHHCLTSLYLSFLILKMGVVIAKLNGYF